jgi:hypothetical protein
MKSTRTALGAVEPKRRSATEAPQPNANVQTDEIAENAASIALLQSWLEADATDDPVEIRRAQQELDEFKRAINAERDRVGARRVYS